MPKLSITATKCYLCGNPGILPLTLKDSFTAHSLAKSPQSDRMCDRCAWVLPLRCWYFNPNKQSWVKLFSRNWSWLYQGDTLLSPTIGPERGEGADRLPTVAALPTRAQIRSWLLEPPEPPFTIAIAESGQKHILPWAQVGHSRDYYPIQFEMDSLLIDRMQFGKLLGHYEALMALGFSKTEIDTAQWHSDRLMKAMGKYEQHDQILTVVRGSRLMALISYVAQLQTEQG